MTISPDDINNPTSLRFAMRNFDNETFPSLASSDFFEALQRGDCAFMPRSIDGMPVPGRVAIPIAYRNRVKVASHNPVAVALEYQAMIENILTILIGCKPSLQHHNNSKGVRTTHFKCREKGIFGRITAFFGMTETQQRKALHFHVILWGGLLPKLLKKVACVLPPEESMGQTQAQLQKLCKEVQTALDSLCSATLPANLHVQNHMFSEMKQTDKGLALLKKVRDKHKPIQAFSVPLLPSSRVANKEDEKMEWKRFFWKCVLQNGIHIHCFTCKKPPAGMHAC